MRKVKMWTLEELKFIKENYNKMTVKQASKHLNRPTAPVRHQAYRMGYKFRQPWEVTEYAYYKGDSLIAIGNVYEISKISGVKVENLLKYRYKCHQNRVNRALIEV